MPYVDGETLRARLTREKQLRVADAIRIVRDVALAVDYAHRHGVVHRDIKPENILLSGDANQGLNAMIADFGIARVLTPTGVTESPLTETGVSMGTPAYMSPEQAAGERELDARSDVYTLATVLYEALAGEPPFAGATAQTIAAKRMSGAVPSVRWARPSVPEGVDLAIRRALAPLPVDRFSSAADFATALEVDETAAVTTAPTTRRVRASGRRPSTVMLVLGALAFIEIAAMWTAFHKVKPVPVRLAVLPFDNLGDSTQAYFADGLTDAIRAKLTALPGVEVIASGSSAQYRHTAKRLQDVGRELNVRYLLMGKVRWAHASGVSGRIQVDPELVDVSSSTDRWSAPYDTTLTDVFGIQTAIAQQVAEALGVTLGAGQRASLAAKPTPNVAAYDAYLQGEALLPRTLGVDIASIRRATADFQQAVTLDSGFARAWARLALVESRVYRNNPSPEFGDRIKAHADRALALSPGLSQAYLALGGYYSRVANDEERARLEDSLALIQTPNDVEALGAMATAELALGHPDLALRRLERMQALDPRSVSVANRSSSVLIKLGRYAESQAAADRGLAIDPADISLLFSATLASAFAHDYPRSRRYAQRIEAIDPTNLHAIFFTTLTYLMAGDLPGARAVLQDPPPGVDRTALYCQMALGPDFAWVLDPSEQRLVLGTPLKTFENVTQLGRGDWALARADLYQVQGDSIRARAYADSARVAATRDVAEDSTDGVNYGLLALADAMGGRNDEAIRAVSRAIALAPMRGDPFTAGQIFTYLARVRMITGDSDGAVQAMATALRIPAQVITPAWLRIDPTWAPLRPVASFQPLLADNR